MYCVLYIPRLDFSVHNILEKDPLIINSISLAPSIQPSLQGRRRRTQPPPIISRDEARVSPTKEAAINLIRTNACTCNIIYCKRGACRAYCVSFGFYENSSAVLLELIVFLSIYILYY